MKYILILITVFLSGCGIQDQLDVLKKQSNKHGQDIIDLQKRISSLEQAVNININNIEEINTSLTSLQGSFNLLSDKESDDATYLQSQISGLVASLTLLQTTVIIQTSNIATLQLNENIISFKDFCGTKPNVYNEVGMITSSGKIVVYFESGGSRFLSILKDGSYVTSDGTSCYFTVTGNGTIITNEHY